MLKAFEFIMIAIAVISAFGMFGDVKDTTYKHHIGCGISGALFLLAEVVRHFIG